MLGELCAAVSLVHLVAAIQIVGFLVRDQIVLRCMILIGACLYLAYYYIEPATPLWDADSLRRADGSGQFVYDYPAS